MEDDPRILYVQTHGIDEVSKAATPFYLATAAAANRAPERAHGGLTTRFAG